MTLPTSLMQLLVEKAAKTRPSKELADSFAAVVCMPTTCGAASNPAHKWARSDGDIASRLPARYGHALRTFIVPLLPWALRHPWAEDISMPQAVNHWAGHMTAQKEPIERVQSLIWGTKAVRAAIEHPQSLPERVQDLRREWHALCDTASVIWKWTDVPELLLPNVYSAWTDLGLIACASPEVQCLHDPRMTLSDSWVKQMGAMFNSLPDAQLPDVLMDVLTSALPDANKLALCKKAPPVSWLNPDVHAALRPLLPPLDRDCFQALPWVTLRRNRMPGQDIADLNQQLAHLYCPSLVVAFTVMLTPSDWTDRQAVQRAVHAGKKPGTPVDTLDITDLVM